MKAVGVWKGVALACGSGALLVAVFPKIDAEPLAWVALVPLLISIDGRRPAAAALLSFVAGMIFFPGIFYWIMTVPDYNVLDHVILASFLACYFALFGFAVAWIRNRTGLPMVVVAPPVWVLSEYLRGHVGFLSLPWLLLGYSQYLQTRLLQVTAWSGVYGLSFLIVLTNAVIADGIRRWQVIRAAGSGPRELLHWMAPPAAVVTSLVLGTLLYGSVVLAQPLPGERMKIAVIQGNIPQQTVTRQAMVDRYIALTRTAAKQAPELIVWPETAVPGDVKHDATLKRLINQVAAEAGTFLLLGVSEYVKFTNPGFRTPDLRTTWYNSVLLVSPDGRLEGEYRKINLVPFGEYVPLKDLVTWPKSLAASFGNALPGDSYTILSVGDRPFGAVICWEIMFGDLVRQFVRRGAGFMINATNESWFGATAAPYQLLAMSAVRAAENRVSIARAASTGISGFIDPYGRIVDRVRDSAGRDIFVEGVLAHDVHVSRTPTFYARHGDVFVFVQIVLVAGLIAVGLARQRGGGADGRRN
jgi:apolipoprotein N-acyltransferase